MNRQIVQTLKQLGILKTKQSWSHSEATESAVALLPQGKMVRRTIVAYILNYNYTSMLDVFIVETLTSMTVALSHGRMVRKSISSHDMLSLSCARSATWRSTCTCVPQPSSVTSLPATWGQTTISLNTLCCPIHEQCRQCIINNGSASTWFKLLYKSTNSKIRECRAYGCKTKAGAEKRKSFLQIPNAKNIPVMDELAMKWLCNICKDHTVAKFN